MPTDSRAAAPQRRTKTPPQYAREKGVAVNKVLHWIKTGQLRAFNGASDPDGKPRYLIDVADIEAFEAQRSVTPPRKSAQPSVRGGFPRDL